MAVPAPSRGAAGGLAEHPRPEVADQAGLLRDRDEHVGRHRVAVLLDPTAQRLERHDRARRQVDDRLEGQAQRAGADGAAQLAGDVDPAERRRRAWPRRRSGRSRAGPAWRRTSRCPPRSAAARCPARCSRVASATPMLTETFSRRPSSTSVSTQAASSDSASRATSSSLPRFSQTTTNSSPPSRATVSLAWARPRSGRRARLSSRSPTPWPSESLTALKSSRSSSSTATRPPVVVDAHQGPVDPVLGQRPVRQRRSSESCSAWCCSSFSSS